MVPEVKLSKLPYEKIKSDTNWFIEGYGVNATFKNWKSSPRQNCSLNSCEFKRIFSVNTNYPDHVAENEFTNVVFDNINDQAIA